MICSPISLLFTPSAEDLTLSDSWRDSLSDSSRDLSEDTPLNSTLNSFGHAKNLNEITEAPELSTIPGENSQLPLPALVL